MGGSAAVTTAVQDTEPLIGKESQHVMETAVDLPCFASAVR
jgi:hypothetical protein